MVLPLAPLKRTSWIRMPPEVCVKWASRPPARIEITPAIANDHLRRMVSLPIIPEPLHRPTGPFCSFALIVIDTVSERLERAQAVVQRAVELSTKNQEALLSRLYCLRNVAGPVIEGGDGCEVLGELFGPCF